MIFVDAAKRAGSFDKAKVRDEIEKTKNFIGTGGVVNMSPTDHLGLDLSAFRMLEIKGGDWTLVQYSEMASSEWRIAHSLLAIRYRKCLNSCNSPSRA
jgi:hypothetical protein